MDTKNNLTAVRGERVGNWVRRVKGLSKETKQRLMDPSHSMVIAKGKEEWAGDRRG